MFYTIYVALLPLFFGFYQMGMPVTIIRTIFQIRKRTTWYRLTGLVGSSLYGLCDKPKQFIFMLEKRTLHQSYFWLVDSYVWGFPIDREIRERSIKVSCPAHAEKDNRSLIMFQVETVILKTSKAVLPSIAVVRSVSCQ